MDYGHARAEAAFDHLDRGVVLFSILGVMLNAFAASVAGVLLTVLAAAMYGLTRNRIANLEAFDSAPVPSALPGVDLRQFTLICQWLGSRHLFEGLLGDLVDPEIGATKEAARRYLREALWLAIAIRVREKIVSLFRFDRPL